MFEVNNRICQLRSLNAHSNATLYTARSERSPWRSCCPCFSCNMSNTISKCNALNIETWTSFSSRLVVFNYWRMQEWHKVTEILRSWHLRVLYERNIPTLKSRFWCLLHYHRKSLTFVKKMWKESCLAGLFNHNTLNSNGFLARCSADPNDCNPNVLSVTQLVWISMQLVYSTFSSLHIFNCACVCACMLCSVDTDSRKWNSLFE